MDRHATPIASRTVSRLKRDAIGGGDTPVKIPESPQMPILGMGSGVKVYSYSRSPRVGCTRSPWAVKRVSKNMGGCWQERLAAEATILRRLNHPNIVGFRAYVPGSDGRSSLAMEKCETSLSDLIESRAENCFGPFAAKPIVKVAADIASALHYLHTEVLIMHGDVKSHNVLIKGDFEIAKLCDFGVYIPVDTNGMMDLKIAGPTGEYIGTQCWTAPEVLDEDNCIVSVKADMFAYGLTLWEMFSLSMPHMEDLDSDLSTDTEEPSFNEESFLAKIGTRPSLPTYPLDEEHEPVVHIFNWCTEADLNSRPSAKQVLDFLTDMKLR